MPALRILLLRNPGIYSYYGLARVLIPGINPNIYGSLSDNSVLSLGKCNLEDYVDLNRGSKSDVVDPILTGINIPVPAGVIAHLLTHGIYAPNNEISLGSIDGLVSLSNKKENLIDTFNAAKKYKAGSYFMDENHCLNVVSEEGLLQPYLQEDIVSFDPRQGAEKIESTKKQLEKFYDSYILKRVQSMDEGYYSLFLKNSHLAEVVTRQIVNDVHNKAIKLNPEHAVTALLSKEKTKRPSTERVYSREEHEKLQAEAAVKDEKYVWDRISGE